MSKDFVCSVMGPVNFFRRMKNTSAEIARPRLAYGAFDQAQ